MTYFFKHLPSASSSNYLKGRKWRHWSTCSRWQHCIAIFLMPILTIFYIYEGSFSHSFLLYSLLGISCINSEAAVSPEGVKRADLLGHYPNSGPQLGKGPPLPNTCPNRPNRTPSLLFSSLCLYVENSVQFFRTDGFKSIWWPFRCPLGIKFCHEKSRENTFEFLSRKRFCLHDGRRS